MGNAAPILVVWLLIVGVPGVLTVWLARRIWKHRTTTTAAAKAAVAIAVGGAVVGTLGTLFGAATALGAFRSQATEPSEKARTLAVGISTAMNCTALGLVIWTPAALVAIVLMRVRRQPSDGR